ncbi:MAG: hypothetical protein WCS77_06635 [Elusimicrobiaceae bacterium]
MKKAAILAIAAFLAAPGFAGEDKAFPQELTKSIVTDLAKTKKTRQDLSNMSRYDAMMFAYEHSQPLTDASKLLDQEDIIIYPEQSSPEIEVKADKSNQLLGTTYNLTLYIHGEKRIRKGDLAVKNGRLTVSGSMRFTIKENYVTTFSVLRHEMRFGTYNGYIVAELEEIGEHYARVLYVLVGKLK